MGIMNFDTLLPEIWKMDAYNKLRAFLLIFGSDSSI